ncbi:hypothetical protein BC829DRAFT_380035 [Chytridium lagenaria]|nr:hypothetical protein BC829DRAFT_380035 [Chytridium lagenaria]
MVQDTLDSLVEAFRSYEEADGQSKGEQFERLSFLVASGKDSADAFSSTVLELRELSEQAVFERLGKAIRTYVKDTALKIDAAVRREADKLLQNVTDDIGRVLEAGDHSDEDLHTMKEELSSILKSVHFAEDIEAKFSELQAHLASKMYRMYVDLVENATFKAEKVVDSRLRVVLREIQKLTPKASVDAEPVQEEIHEPTPPPVVPRPQKETHEPTPPPVVPRPPKETHEPTPPPWPMTVAIVETPASPPSECKYQTISTVALLLIVVFFFF